VLKETFLQLICAYTFNEEKQLELWNEIALKYTAPRRHYHNLMHLENLLALLVPLKNEIAEWNTVLFSLYYHDVIYNPLKTNNEENSAAFAVYRMRAIDVPEQIIENTSKQILATKKHDACADNDTNLFTDADLSILGQPWEVYIDYYKQVRKEYALFPDIIYKPGRRKVLQHFLQMDNIFKTRFFNSRFELQAKENLKKELELL
jgi:predicted metal-dependent HD superfamily phosphohydrolase